MRRGWGVGGARMRRVGGGALGCCTHVYLWGCWVQLKIDGIHGPLIELFDCDEAYMTAVDVAPPKKKTKKTGI